MVCERKTESVTYNSESILRTIYHRDPLQRGLQNNQVMTTLFGGDDQQLSRIGIVQLLQRFVRSFHFGLEFRETPGMAVVFVSTPDQKLTK